MEEFLFCRFIPEITPSSHQPAPFICILHEQSIGCSYVLKRLFDIYRVGEPTLECGPMDVLRKSIPQGGLLHGWSCQIFTILPSLRSDGYTGFETALMILHQAELYLAVWIHVTRIYHKPILRRSVESSKSCYYQSRFVIVGIPFREVKRPLADKAAGCNVQCYETHTYGITMISRLEKGVIVEEVVVCGTRLKA